MLSIVVCVLRAVCRSVFVDLCVMCGVRGVLRFVCCVLIAVC